MTKVFAKGSTLRQLRMILLSSLAGGAAGGIAAHFFDPTSLDIYRQAGGYGGAMLSIATGIFRW